MKLYIYSMAYDEYLQERIENVLNEKHVPYEAKKMFGGICFMIDGKMCIGVVKNDLMARVGEKQYDELLKRKGAREMDFTKRPMKGYLFISPKGIDGQKDLEFWVDRCLAFNPEAKASRKKA